MAIIQDAFYIPEDISIKLITGEYRRIGGVVRYASGPKKGQIVKHLKSVELSYDTVQDNVIRVFNIAKRHKKPIVIAISVASAIGGGYLIYKLYDRFKPESKEIVEFRKNFEKYINSLRTGTLTIEIINDLIASIEVIKKRDDYENVIINLTAEEISTIINHIASYTEFIAEKNSYDISNKRTSETDSLNLFLFYLLTQKQIFEKANK